MGERLKDMFFTRQSIGELVSNIQEVYSGFNRELFLEHLYSEEWEDLELKGRMRHTTLCLKVTLPEDFIDAVEILKKIAPRTKGFEAMTLPDYVEIYGLKYWDISMSALKHFTRFSSSEFGIRPFLDYNPEKAMEFLTGCADDKDEKIRRWASEGCRPRLPWAMALPKFKKDPSLIFTVLEKLKNDPSETVRRSVANNLNDISKDNPDLMLIKCAEWVGKSKHTDWIIKHACRSLLKAGHPQALELFGFGNPEDLRIECFGTVQNSIKTGEKLEFSFTLKVPEKGKIKARLEYAIDYMKANGKRSRKIFKITENTYKPGKYKFNRSQSFKNMTTRKHYPGEHGLAIIVNGQEKQHLTFILK